MHTKRSRRAMVVAWDPDGCAVIAEDDQDEKEAMDNGRACVGWLTYVSDRKGRLPPLPEPVHVEQMEHRGRLITLTPERFSLSNPAHVALARHVREQLEHAGLLPPLGL